MPARPRIDCHSHSAYSGHGQGTVAQMVARADGLGLSVFAQTEHLVLPQGMDPSFETSLSKAGMRSYIEDVAEQREILQEHNSGLQLICGIEADWLSGRTDELTALCAPFEYVLGSVHFVDMRPIDDSRDLSLWDEVGIDEVWRRYFVAWLDMAAHPGPIMTFAHPDLPKKYGWLPSFDLRPYYLEMAKAAARSGCMVEVNTAGLRKDVGEMYPSLELLKAFRAENVACTVGSDAHCPGDVAAHFDEACALMLQAGYEFAMAPTQDKDRISIALA